MTGKELKRRLSALGISLSEVAEKLNMSQQNLSRALAVADIKTGLLERICEALGKNISFFYENTKYLAFEKTTNYDGKDEINHLKGQIEALKDVLEFAIVKKDSGLNPMGKAG